MVDTINILLHGLERSFNRKSWHGTNLLGSLRRVTLEEACWRPEKGRHNIWELVPHAAYWKYSVRRRITGEKRGSFPLTGSDWFKRPMELSSRSWKADLQLLEDEHAKLLSAVACMDSTLLGKVPEGSSVDFESLILGVAAHDVYHAGQVQLLKRLYRSRG